MEMEKEELKKELEKLKDFKVYVFEGDVYVKAEDYKKIAIKNKNLKEEKERLELSSLASRKEADEYRTLFCDIMHNLQELINNYPKY